MIAALALAVSLVPMHGVVLSPAPGGAIVRNERIPATLDAGTRRYRLSPAIETKPGVGIDGYLDRSTTPWTLRSPSIAAPFSPGIPEPERVVPVDVGTSIPDTELIDQSGAFVHLDRSFAGKTRLISFVFTRCADRDICPAISGKFAYLQSHLDPAKFALIEITLDPPYDSPAILREYGRQYGADPRSWSLLTGTGSVVQRLLDEFKIDSLRVSSANFIHNDKLYIVTPSGKVAYVVETAAWDPRGVMAEAQAISGMRSNPFERFKLSLVASVVALCGGSQFAGVVLLEMALFFVILIIVVSGLWWVGRVLVKDR